MCDQERYLELHTDIQEQALYEEEEWKRYYQSLSEGFNAVGFVYEQQYDPSLPTDEDQELTAALEAAVEKFVAPKELLVPSEMIIPDSNKINAIIEKTASFVVMQGGQMEIMIKTKQSSNPLFEFLNIDNILYPYYKHMIKMIKSGKYKPKVDNESEDEDDNDDDDDDDNQSYLHPILTVKSQPAECRKPLKMPTVDIQNTTYGDLIRSVKASTARQNAKKIKAKELEASDPKPSIPPFMAQPVYGPNVPPPPGVEPVTLPPSDQPPPPGTDNAVPLCLPKYDSSDSPENTTGSDYGSQQNDIIPPSPDVQPVIDKMALYVAKNGIEFEMVVKNKCDPRFEFLNKDHLHHPYYEFKKQLHIKEFEKERKKIEEQKAAQNKGVSFSIKTKTKEQESVSLEKRPVFACESSEDESEADVHKQSQTNSPDAESGEFQSSKKSTEIKAVSEDKMEKPDSSQEDMTRKLAEEKLKDRLALAAREKLAQATKEKQLQAERKRKAALFINMLKSSNQLLPHSNNSENAEGDHLEIGSSGNTPIPSQASSPQLDTNYQSANSVDYTLDSSSKGEIGRSSSERGNEKSDHQQQSSSHTRNHQRHSRSPTPPSAYNLPRSRYHNSAVVLPHRSEKSQSSEKRSRSPYSKKVSKSPSRKRSSSKSPSRKGKSSMTKSPSPSKRKHQHSQSRSRSRSPSRYVSNSRQNRRRDWSRSPNYASSHNRSSKLRRHSRSRSPSHPSRSQYTSLGTQSHRREKSRSRSQSRSHRERSKSPNSKKNNKSPSRKRSHSKSPFRKFKPYSKSPNSKKKHKRSRSRSSSKKRSKSSRLESEKNSTKLTSKSKSRKDSKDKKSHLSSKSIKKDTLKKKNGDVTDKRKELSKNGGPTIDLTTKSDSLVELSSETENDVNNQLALPNDHKSTQVTVPTKSEPQVSETILSKVRAMLKASRQAILKEEKECSDV